MTCLATVTRLRPITKNDDLGATIMANDPRHHGGTVDRGLAMGNLLTISDEQDIILS